MPVKEVYYDMQVLDTNNYVTEDGTIHHNSGKSSGCVMELMNLAKEQAPNQLGIRRSRWAVVRSHYGQLRDTTIKTFTDWIPPKYFGEYRIVNHEFFIDKIRLDDGTRVESEILFRALDRPDHVSNLLSLEVTGAWINEVRETPKIIFDALDGRCGRFPPHREEGCTWAGIIADTNPPDTDHWIYKLFEQELASNPELQSKYAIFHQPSGRSDRAENLRNLPKDYYQNLAIGKTPEFIKVYIDGEYGYLQDGRPVFINYSDALHCAEKDIAPIRGLPLLIGADFGFTPAVTISQVTAKGQVHLLQEIVTEEMSLRSMVRDLLKPALLNKYHGLRVIGAGDPAGIRRQDTDGRNCFMELKDAGISVVPARTNSFSARYAAVDSVLTKTIEGKPAFRVSPSCTVFRKGMVSHYRYKRIGVVGKEMYRDVPDKTIESHVVESFQYAMLYMEQVVRNEKRDREGRELSLVKPVPNRLAWS